MKRIAKALLGFNAISLRHLARLKSRQFLAACTGAFTEARWADSDDLYSIPEISLGEILGDRKPSIRRNVVRDEDGVLPSDQAMALLSILVAENPREVLEIGTFMGCTTRQMAENLPAATIHTVDLPEDYSVSNDEQQDVPKDDFHLIQRRTVGREYKGQPCAERIVQHFSDTAAWDFKGTGKPGFIFIDGSHTYEYCKNDTEKCLPLADAGAVFLWHDCDDSHPGVVRYLRECRERGMDVKRIADTPIGYWKRP